MEQQADPKSGGWKSWFAHAFAVEKPGDIEPTPAQIAIVDRLCSEIVRRGMATPALMALEMSRPLNMLSASAMHLLQPIIAVVTDTRSYEAFAQFLEHRGSIEFLCARIEHFQAHGSGASETGGETKRRRDEETK